MRILRLNNDLCELAEIDGSLESMQYEVNGWIEVVPLTSSLRLVIDEEGKLYELNENLVATVLLRHFIKRLADDRVVGPAFLCSFDGKESLVSLTDEDYETAAKVLRSYGYVKGD